MSATTVQSFYIAYYGRPADPSGLDYWVGRVTAEGSFDSLVAAFGTSAEATELFSGLTDAQKINAVYQATFGRDADAEGLAFYSAGLADGTFTVYDISKRILDGATTGDDAAIVANKITVAQAFTDELAADPEAAAEYVGIAATTSAKALVSAVDATAASVTTATAQISVVLGVTTSTLTTGVDTIAGTAGRDKISGGVTSLSSTDTLQVTDQIDGGEGTDTLTLSVSKNFAGLTVGTGYIKNVENLVLNNGTVTSYTFSARGITDVDSLTISGPISLSGVSSLETALTVKSIATSSDVSISFDGAVVSGTTDSLTLNLDSLGTAGTSSSASASTVVELQTPSVEALNLVVTGSNYVDLTSTGVNALTISGSGNLSLVDQTTLTLAGMTKGVGSGVKSIDASAMTGNLTAQLLAATSVNTVKLGSGTNTIYATDTDLAGNATVTGGSGTDTLVLNTTGAQTYGFSLAGIETVSLGSIAVGTLSFSGAKASDISSVYLSNLAANSITTNLVSMGASDLGITVQAAASTTDSAAHTLTTDSEGAVSIGVAVSSTASSSANQQSADNITPSKATSFTLSVAKFGDYDGDVTAAKATTVTVTGDGTVDGNATLKLAAAKSLVLNQTNKDTIWDVEYEKGVATASVLTSLDVTAKGTMTVTTTDDLVALENLTVSTDNHFNTLSAADLGAISTLTVSGAENVSEFTAAGELGGDTLAYGITVTASGLKNDLNLSGIAVGASQAITVNVGDVNGNVALGALEVHSAASTTTTSSGSVTVNGRNHGDSFNNTGTAAADDSLGMGAVTAKTITIDVDGAATVTTGILSGRTITVQGNNTKSLTVNSSTTLDGTADISVRDALTFYGSDLSATVLDVEIASGSTAFTADLKGGILGDLLAFTSANTGQTSITLTGDLVGTGNTVSVTSSASTASAGQTINISGLVGANNTTLVGSAGKDTITGSTGVDSIDASTGADVIYTGAGNDFVFIDTGDTGAISTVLTNASGTTTDSWSTSYTVTSGHRVSTTSLDKVMDFSIGDTIGIYDRSTPVVTDTSNAIGSAYVASSVGKYAGTYDATGQTFTFSESGVDSLLVYDGDGTGAATTYYGVVLVGYTTTFTADAETVNTSFTGLVGSAA